MKFLYVTVLVLFCCLASFAGASKVLGTCTLVFNQNRSKADIELGDARTVVDPLESTPSRGPVGPRGRTGERGAPGPPGDCSCPDFAANISNIEQKLRDAAEHHQLFIATILSGNDWQKAPNDNWYKVFPANTYEKAKVNCKSLGSQLLAIGFRDRAAKRAIIENIINPSINNFWIGLDDLQEQGRWVWSDGVVASSEEADWAQGEPNNSGGSERCVHAGRNGKTNDITCNKLFHYICELWNIP